MRLLSNPVGRTQKTSFLLSSNSRASLCSDFKTNPNSCEHIRPIHHFTAKALAIHFGREYPEWLVENITWQLGDSLHRNLANGNCPWLGEAGNSNEYNVCKTDSPYFLASLPSLALCFQPRSTPFVWLLARTWIRKIRTVLQSIFSLIYSYDTTMEQISVIKQLRELYIIQDDEFRYGSDAWAWCGTAWPWRQRSWGGEVSLKLMCVLD